MHIYLNHKIGTCQNAYLAK